MMKMQMMKMRQPLFLLFRFVPVRRNKVFWLAQAVSAEFTPLCSFVLFIYIYIRGAKHALQCKQAGFLSFREASEGRYMSGTNGTNANEQPKPLNLLTLVNAPKKGTSRNNWNRTL
jgi:hypothetical protein